MYWRAAAEGQDWRHTGPSSPPRAPAPPCRRRALRGRPLTLACPAASMRLSTSKRQAARGGDMAPAPRLAGRLLRPGRSVGGCTQMGRVREQIEAASWAAWDERQGCNHMSREDAPDRSGACSCGPPRTWDVDQSCRGRVTIGGRTARWQRDVWSLGKPPAAGGTRWPPGNVAADAASRCNRWWLLLACLAGGTLISQALSVPREGRSRSDPWGPWGRRRPPCTSCLARAAAAHGPSTRLHARRQCDQCQAARAGPRSAALPREVVLLLLLLVCLLANLMAHPLVQAALTAAL